MKTILIADDDRNLALLYQQELGEEGYQVEVVHDGRQAIERVAEAPPDLLVLDIRMPGMDGLEALRRLRQNEAWKAVKVVAISASVLDHEQQEYMEAGFDAFIAKPFRFEKICASLAALLQVEFAYAEAEATEDDGDWRAVALPTDLHERLQKAAEFYSVTEMDDYLEELEQLGAESRKLAAHLRDLKQRYDMDSILDTLREIRHE